MKTFAVSLLILIYLFLFSGCFKIEVPVKEVAEVAKDAYKATKEKLSEKDNENVEVKISKKELISIMRETLSNESKTAHAIDKGSDLNIIIKCAREEGLLKFADQLELKTK